MPNENDVIAASTQAISNLYTYASNNDVRIKNLESERDRFDQKLGALDQRINKLDQITAITEHTAKDTKQILREGVELNRKTIESSFQTLKKELSEFTVNYDKQLDSLRPRLMSIESSVSDSQSRYTKVAEFVGQLIWVILAALLLAAFGLQGP